MLGDLGVQGRSLLKRLLGLPLLAQLPQHNALVVPSVGVAGMGVEHSGIAGQRFYQAVGLAQRHAAVEPDFHVLRIDLKRLLIAGQLHATADWPLMVSTRS